MAGVTLGEYMTQPVDSQRWIYLIGAFAAVIGPLAARGLRASPLLPTSGKHA